MIADLQIRNIFQTVTIFDTSRGWLDETALKFVLVRDWCLYIWERSWALSGRGPVWTGLDPVQWGRAPSGVVDSMLTRGCEKIGTVVKDKSS